MRLFLLLLVTLIQQTNQLTSLPLQRQLQTVCPSLALAESYSTSFKSLTFSISPTITTNCGTSGKTFNVTAGDIVNRSGLRFNLTSKQITISDWTQFQDGSFYLVAFQMTFVNNTNTSQIIILQDNFYLNIGAQNIQYTALGTRVFQYYENIGIDYTNAFDPQQPETGNLAVSYACDSVFNQCSTLTKSNMFTPINRIQQNWAFDLEYSINATIQNKNTNYFKTAIDRLTLYQEPPEYSNIPEECVDFKINIRNLNYTVDRISNSKSRILYDNLNFTDFRMLAPTVSIARCTNYNNPLSTLVAINQNNPMLFSSPRTFIFNGTDVIISRAKLQQVLMSYPKQEIRMYVFLYETDSTLMRAYYMHKLSLEMNDQTLYAIIGLSLIQVDRDKVLYIDASSSYDTVKSGFSFVWGLQGQPNAQFTDTKILSLTPDQRTALGINSAGKYYNFTLYLKDSSRASSQVKTRIQITPEPDPQGCYQVALKDIDLETIITYTIWPLILQAKVTDKRCTGARLTAITWKSSSINYVFWQNFGNDNTILIDRDTLKQLPKNNNIYMSVTVTYMIGDTEYLTKKLFTLLVQKPDLIPVVTYPSVINLKEQNLTLDGSLSYDPQAVAAGTADVPVVYSNNYPKCNIVFQKDISISQTAFVQAQCPSIAAGSIYSYQWNIFNWGDKVRISTINDKLITSNSILRIPPFVLSNYEAILIIVTVTNGTFQTPIAIYKTVNDQGQFIVGQLTPNYNQFTSYLSNFVLTPANWDSGVSSNLQFQMRIKYSDSPVPLYRVLLTPRSASSTKTIQTILPPITYENSMYYDIVDTDMNYMTVKKSIISTPDILMTASTFYTRVNSIISDVIYTFDEQAFELIIVKLMLYYQAYRQDQIDMQGVPASYFKNMSEGTVSYLYNAILIDQRLNSITSKDRFTLVKQNILELCSYLVFKNKDISNVNNLIQILNATVNSGDFYLTTLLPDIALKVYQTIIILSDNQLITLKDTVLSRIQGELQYYYFPDEALQYTYNGYTLIFYKIPTSNPTNIPTIDGFSYPQSLLLTSTFAGGSLFVIKNDTSVSAQIYSSKQTVQVVTGLTQSIYLDFKMTQDQVQKNSTSNLTFYCAYRQDLSKAWSNSSTLIQFVSYTQTTGIVRCKSTGFGHYSLFIQDLTRPSTVVILPNTTDNQTIDGKWNDTIVNNTDLISQIDPILYFEEHTTFTILAIITLALFVLSSYIFHVKYRDEHQIQTDDQIYDLFEISLTDTLLKNRCRLYLKIIQNFNPYVNLFLIYNKFLKRWVRNSLLQIYFMTISIIFAINQYMLTMDISQLGKSDPQQLIALFVISVVIVLFGRPWAIKMMYRLLYEPDSKVEDFDYTINTDSLSLKFENRLKAVTFDQKDDFEKKAIKMSLPKLFDNDSREGSSTLKQYESSGIVESRRSEISSIRNIQQEPVPFGVQNGFREGQSSIPSQQDYNNLPAFQSRASQVNYSARSKESASNKKMRMDTDMDKYINQNGMQHQPLISEQASKEEEESKISEKLNRSNSIAAADKSISIDHKPSRNEEFHLPSINLGMKQYQKGMFDEEDGDFNLMDQPQAYPHEEESQPTNDFHMNLTQQNQDNEREAHQRNYFDEFNMMGSNNQDDEDENEFRHNNFQQYEGGEKEDKLNDLDEVEDINDSEPGLNRSDIADDQVQITNIMHSQHLRSDMDVQQQNTEFMKETNKSPPAKVRNSSSLRQKDIKEALSQQEFAEQDSLRSDLMRDQSQLINEEKKTYYINKIIGKWILFIIWGGLGAINLICIQHMARQHFFEWITLSLVTFFLIIFVIDPILYFILSLVMIKSQTSRKVQYYTRRQNKVTCSQVFVLMFIGKEKMRDLRRNLNPVKKNHQNQQATVIKEETISVVKQQ